MWSREILKSNAKIALTGRYWRAFVVALLVSLLSGLANLGNTLSRLADTYESFWGIWGAHDLENFSTHVHFMNWLDAWTVALALFGFLLAVFVYNVFQVGQARYFVQNHFGGTSIETLFSGFRSGDGNTVAACMCFFGRCCCSSPGFINPISILWCHTSSPTTRIFPDTVRAPSAG